MSPIVLLKHIYIHTHTQFIINLNDLPLIEKQSLTLVKTWTVTIFNVIQILFSYLKKIQNERHKAEQLSHSVVF